MLQIRKLTRVEVFDLYHKQLEEGWQVVRAKLKTKEDAIKRIQYLKNRAALWNVSLQEFESVVKIGVDNFINGKITIDVKTPEELLQIRVWDAIREIILIIVLFDLAGNKEIKEQNLLLK